MMIAFILEIISCFNNLAWKMFMEISKCHLTVTHVTSAFYLVKNMHWLFFTFLNISNQKAVIQQALIFVKLFWRKDKKKKKKREKSP